MRGPFAVVLGVVAATSTFMISYATGAGVANNCAPTEGAAPAAAVGAADITGLPTPTGEQLDYINSPAGGTPPTQRHLSADQLYKWKLDRKAKNATAIIQVGKQQGLPPRGWVVALATALVESWMLRLGSPNDPASGQAIYDPEGWDPDLDSVGLFQQRDNGAWGTLAERMNAQKSSEAFYRALKRINGWENMGVGAAAQKVQGSAHPERYDKHVKTANELVQKYANGAYAPVANCEAQAPGVPGDARPPVPGKDANGKWPAQACSVTNSKGGSACVTPRTAHMIDEAVRSGFPKPLAPCNRGGPPDHGAGRACDFMYETRGSTGYRTREGHVKNGPYAVEGSKEKQQGDAMAAWAVKNAGVLGIEYVIWYDKIWSIGRSGGWRDYTNEAERRRTDPGGVHANHVHISMTESG